MSHFAAALIRGADGWSAAELDLSGAADVEEVADRLRDVDQDAVISLLFVESDDAYLTILRLDEGEDLRVFGSDGAFAGESRLGALLLGDVEEPAVEVIEPAEEDDDAAEDDEDSDDRPAADPDAEPVGDLEIISDLGVPGKQLLHICAREGMLPADMTAEVCQLIGCGDEVEELREG